MLGALNQRTHAQNFKPYAGGFEIHGLPQKEKNENTSPMLMKSTQANWIFHEAPTMYGKSMALWGYSIGFPKIWNVGRLGVATPC